ncbi:protein lev-9 [Trichonephila clavata]|uniref:Protein lev-9 n=1 Tax=Trichonephila clavata TaxID=2740835 RepID=A0A8X6HPX2_TRICU|nr:protein lev-9 [Trichonephila clavata]
MILGGGYENLSSQYYNKLTITNIDQHHNGWYECLVTGFSPSDIFIQVINPVAAKCPKLEDGDFVIQYDNEQFVNSSAIFSCKGSNQKLVGSRVLTCMPNGQWSGYKPQCEKLCPEIPETEGMTITYTSDQSIGSLAVFHCFAPRVRTGVSRTTCEQNGEWKDPVPTCTLPTCLIDDLFKIVSKNVVPDMKTVSSENVPFNSTIDLTCEHGYWLSGYNKAKCGPNGIWEVSKAECFTGCPYPVNSQDSDLMIDPNRDHYRRGELVTLSCPSGQILSSEVVRLLCLNSGWSQSDLPHCINA